MTLEKNEPEGGQRQQSKYMRKPEEYIRRWQNLATPEGYYYVADLWTSSGALHNRDAIRDLGLEDGPRVKKADQEVLKLTFKNHPEYPDVEEGPPLDRWWYYLPDIKDGTYPAEFLPDHLKDLYTEYLENLKRSKGF